MFVLNHKYEFPSDPTGCRLGASLGYASNGKSDLSWSLDLHSTAIATQISPSKSEENLEPPEKQANEQLSFGISCGFTLEVSDWKELSGTEFGVPSDDLGWGFQIEQWEELIALNLKFGTVRENRIEITATGCGLAESIRDLFPEERVDFSIQTWVRFIGIGVWVPLNAADPMAYSLARLRALSPKYQFANPQIKETKEPDGKLLAIEVLYPPKVD